MQEKWSLCMCQSKLQSTNCSVQIKLPNTHHESSNLNENFRDGAYTPRISLLPLFQITWILKRTGSLYYLMMLLDSSVAWRYSRSVILSYTPNSSHSTLDGFSPCLIFQPHPYSLYSDYCTCAVFSYIVLLSQHCQPTRLVNLNSHHIERGSVVDCALHPPAYIILSACMHK